jgi:hypothetical protein
VTGLGAGQRQDSRFQRYPQRQESRLHRRFTRDRTIGTCRRELFPDPDDTTINDDVAVPPGILSRGAPVTFEFLAIASSLWRPLYMTVAAVQDEVGDLIIVRHLP